MKKVLCLAGVMIMCSCSNSSVNTQSSLIESSVSKVEMFNLLKGSVYSDNASVKGIGLSDTSNVGILQDKLENEVLYPVLNDSDYAKIYNVNDYQINPNNSDNWSALNNLLTLIKSEQGLKKVYFPSGTYKFLRTISLYELDNVYFVGDNTLFLGMEWMHFITINKCSNIHFNNINIDYQISPTISGKVVSANSENKSVTILVDSEFDLSDYHYNNGKITYGNYMEYYFDDFTNSYVPNINGMLRYNSTGDNVKAIQNGTYDANTFEYTIYFKDAIKAPKIGVVVSVSFTMYEFMAYTLTNSLDSYFEHCDVYMAPGMAWYFKSNKNIYMNHCNLILKPNSKRLQTSTADGLHPIDTAGDLIVTNSIYENSHDDALNICTFYHTISEHLRKNITIVPTSNEVNIEYSVGDRIQIYDPSSLKPLYQRTITSLKKYGSSYELVLDANIANTPNILGYKVANMARLPKLRVDNCLFRNKRNRGILAQTRNSIIMNCAFINVLMGPIMIFASLDSFSEGVVPENFIIKNNKFINNAGLEGDINVFKSGGVHLPNTFKNILIENNFHYKSNIGAIYLDANGQSNILSNLFYDVNKKSGSFAILVRNSENINIKNNYIFFSEQKKEYQMLLIENSQNVICQNNRGENI
jgi:hypothetical protein